MENYLNVVGAWVKKIYVIIVFLLSCGSLSHLFLESGLIFTEVCVLYFFTLLVI